jgi:diaminopimelate decarboxylase/aspartate kinase
MNDTETEALFGSSASLGAPVEIAESPWTVMKFGGTSVSSAKSWSVIAGLIRNRLADDLKLIIVHSALKGVSNELQSMLQEAAAGKTSDGLAKIRGQHYELATALGLDGPGLLADSLHELEQLVAGVRLVREVSVRVHVRIMALGELMATRLGAEYLRRIGLPVEWADARDLLTTVSSSGGQRTQDYLSAKCDANSDLAFQNKLDTAGV